MNIFSGLSWPLIVILLPFIYFLTRDLILLILRRKDKLEERNRVIESERKLYESMKTLQKNRTEMVDNIQRLSEEIKNFRPKKPPIKPRPAPNKNTNNDPSKKS
jgi:hypothetical protein